MYKAVISDLDGTLLNDRSKISDFTRETVREVIDRGVKFYIATGRNYGLAKAVMDELGITIPLISANGARINDEDGEVIFEDLLGKEEAEKILEVDYRKYGENDYEMLTIAGKGFIMGNALYRLKDMLPEDFEIIGTNNEDGEAKKLVEIFLNN